MSQQQASAAQLPLKQRLLAYFQKRPGEFIASGDIQRMVTEKTRYTAANATRRLRELHEAGELERELRKGHAFYAYNPHHVKRISTFKEVDGRMVEIISEVVV